MDNIVIVSAVRTPVGTTYILACYKPISFTIFIHYILYTIYIYYIYYIYYTIYIYIYIYIHSLYIDFIS